MGIMNGTTNFMLCKMEDEGKDYGDALKEAQVLCSYFSFVRFEIERIP
jgi:homoserine dehydrogenase